MGLVMIEFKVVGMDKAGRLLLIRSLKSKKEFKDGGLMHGCQYEIGINSQTFKYCKISLLQMTGMTDEEYNKWEKEYELD